MNENRKLFLAILSLCLPVSVAADGTGLAVFLTFLVVFIFIGIFIVLILVRWCVRRSRERDYQQNPHLYQPPPPSFPSQPNNYGQNNSVHQPILSGFQHPSQPLPPTNPYYQSNGFSTIS
eukprot:TRINITY_DN5494_c0_g1_i1.p1 TRINITY_DN5494_c0_g1~~TRINITY_DN5494_c0_g1_i1.p1  ORF type:complete len:120 (-),score=24.84 TRINITY_DN5494_c0_g1_i1:179-538(-)